MPGAGPRRAWPRAELLPLVPFKTGSVIFGDKHPFKGNECALSESEQSNQYVVDELQEAFFRVLFSNPPKTQSDVDLRRTSILGLNGHVERANAWSHIVAGAFFAGFVCLRPAIDALDNTSIAGQLSALSATASAVTFATSYHGGNLLSTS